MAVSLGKREGSVQLGRVKVAVDGLELSFSLRVRCPSWGRDRKVGGLKGDGKEGVEAWNGEDSS
jgi:hypothetical protein